MSNNNKWEALSMKDRAFLIRQAVKNGITDVGEVKKLYQESHQFSGEEDTAESLMKMAITSKKDKFTYPGQEIVYDRNRQKAIDDINQRLVRVENSKTRKGGWDKNREVWVPHKSFESGYKTIGYGLKLTPGSEVKKLVDRQGFLTEAQEEYFRTNNVKKSHTKAKQVYENLYGEDSFEDLHYKTQSLLTDKEYNVRKGLKEWPGLMNSVNNTDIPSIRDNIVTKARNPKTKKLEVLKGRNDDFLKDIDSLEMGIYPIKLGNHSYSGETSNPPESVSLWDKLYKAYSEGARMARDARIGNPAAQMVRDLYDSGEKQKALDLAKSMIKANSAGIALGAGAASSGLLADLAVTAGTTGLDTITEESHQNLGKDLAKNVVLDILGHGASRVLNTVKNKVSNPASIQDIIDYINRGNPKEILNKDNFVSLLDNASTDELKSLLQTTRWFDGDWGLLDPLINIKLGNMHNFHVSVNDAMQKMRHGRIPDSKFIKDATERISKQWDKYLSQTGNNGLSVRHLFSKSIPAKKYISHGISTSVFNRAIQKGDEAIMPSLAILPQDTDNRWGDILFIGDKGMLDKAKIYKEDAWTPIVGKVLDKESKSNREILEEMLRMPNERDVLELSIQDLDNMQFHRKIPTEEVGSQNSFANWFFSQVPTKNIPGDANYMEAKYHDLLPFSSFKHMLVPKGASEAIDWAKKTRMPYTIYDQYNWKGAQQRYKALQTILEDSDVLFKNGGKLK